MVESYSREGSSIWLNFLVGRSSPIIRSSARQRKLAKRSFSDERSFIAVPYAQSNFGINGASTFPRPTWRTMCCIENANNCVEGNTNSLSMYATYVTVDLITCQNSITKYPGLIFDDLGIEFAWIGQGEGIRPTTGKTSAPFNG